MIEKADIEHLIEAERSIRSTLFPSKHSFLEHFHSAESRAAKVLCKELSWLAFERPDFWRELKDGSKELNEKYRDEQNQFFEGIRDLVDLEVGAFEKLGIAEADSLASLRWVYNAIEIANSKDDVPTPEALANLQNRLGVAAKLVCEASKGKLRRAVEGVMSLTGARIFAGATIMGVNVAVAHADFGVVSWKSLGAGYLVMKDDVEKLVKLLGGKED
jgi:hypothetical protein